MSYLYSPGKISTVRTLLFSLCKTVMVLPACHHHKADGESNENLRETRDVFSKLVRELFEWHRVGEVAMPVLRTSKTFPIMSGRGIELLAWRLPLPPVFVGKSNDWARGRWREFILPCAWSLPKVRGTQRRDTQLYKAPRRPPRVRASNQVLQSPVKCGNSLTVWPLQTC